MGWLSGRRARREAELDEEIRAHLRLAVEARIARGESPAEAVRAARREFGSVLEVKEVTRSMWGELWVERLVQDVRYAARSLARAPAFTSAAVVTLALGIGATTAVFTVVHGILLRPLPFPDPDRLVLIAHGAPPGRFSPTPGMAEPDYLELARQDVGFEHVSTFSNEAVALTGAGDPVRLNAAVATVDLFRVLGVPPALGRGFEPGEGSPGRDDLVVLGDGLWRTRFAADAGVVGSTVVIDGVMRTVIGIMPPGFDFPNGADLWLPFEVTVVPGVGRSRPVIARLRSGVPLERARTTFADFLERLPAPEGEVVSSVEPLKEYVVGRTRHTLLVFMGAVAFVLLIACINVANLLLMRGAQRTRELTVRTALGAGRGRLVRQLLTESSVIALLGGIAGIVLAYAGVQALLAVAPAQQIPRVDSVRVDGVVLGVALLVSLGTALTFGLVPSLYAARGGSSGALNTRGRAPSRDRGRTGSILALGQVAIALVLLTGAGLLARSVRNLSAVELGFIPNGALTMTVDLPASSYPDAASMQAVHARVLERLDASPMVHAAGAVNWRPFGDMLISGDFAVENAAAPASSYWADKLAVSEDYFDAMGIRLLRGRAFTGNDRSGAPPVAIVSRSLAVRFWPGRDPVGRRLALGSDPEPDDWITVVGIVDDVLQRELTGSRAATIYQPLAQVERPFFLGRMTYVARSNAASTTLAAVMRDAVRTADPSLPVHTAASMDELVSAQMHEPRFQAWLLATFSGIALMLAAVGVYGVLADSVAQRRFEIGLRMALGARASDVVASVIRHSLLLTAVGLVLGAIGAFAATRTLSGYLFRVTPADPVTFAASVAVLAVTALIAAWIPARRAAAVHPATVLKSE